MAQTMTSYSARCRYANAVFAGSNKPGKAGETVPCPGCKKPVKLRIAPRGDISWYVQVPNHNALSKSASGLGLTPTMRHALELIRKHQGSEVRANTFRALKKRGLVGSFADGKYCYLFLTVEGHRASEL